MNSNEASFITKNHFIRWRLIGNECVRFMFSYNRNSLKKDYLCQPFEKAGVQF